MKFYIADCFAEEKYQGNELLVVIADRFVSDREQQQIAREINFSETAFILSGKQDNGGYDVRIWTPSVGEVPFAGHPSLGTACVIHRFIERGQSDIVKLNLKVGQIPVAITENGLTMSQKAPVFGETIPKEEIAEVFGISPGKISGDYPVQWVSTGLAAVIIPLKDREALSRVRTNREAFEHYILRHSASYCSHLFFTDMGNKTFAARCLMEDYLEDPATGSANGDLAGYLLQHDYFNRSDIDYTVIQGEDMGRKSVLRIHAGKKADAWTIEVGGQCHIVACGEWE